MEIPPLMRQAALGERSYARQRTEERTGNLYNESYRAHYMTTNQGLHHLTTVETKTRHAPLQIITLPKTKLTLTPAADSRFLSES